MSLRQGVSAVDVRSGQGRFSEKVTSFKGLTAGEEAAAALWAPDRQPEACGMAALGWRLGTRVSGGFSPSSDRNTSLTCAQIVCAAWFVLSTRFPFGSLGFGLGTHRCPCDWPSVRSRGSGSPQASLGDSLLPCCQGSSLGNKVRPGAPQAVLKRHPTSTLPLFLADRFVPLGCNAYSWGCVRHGLSPGSATSLGVVLGTPTQ